MTMLSVHHHDESDHAADIINQLQKASHLLRGLLSAHFAEFGLNDVRYAALKIVQSAPAPGCTQTLLADQLQQSESSVSTLVERMRADGLLYRMTSKLDRRKRVLMLSEQARTLLEQVDRCHAERMAQLLRGMPAEYQIQLTDLLIRLVDELTFVSQEASVSLKMPWQGQQPQHVQPHLHQESLPEEDELIRRAA